jgi:TDG/mug DNA glycosylase family protein
MNQMSAVAIDQRHSHNGSIFGDDMAMKEGLDPVVDDDFRILILGTFPGEESLRLRRYYADPQNQFWAILARVYDEESGTDYRDQLNFLRRKGLALWDVLQAAERDGSKDSKIKNRIPNDFSTFFKKYPRLRTIAFNSVKARTWYFSDVFKQQLPPGISLPEEPLPSTSPSPGRYVLPLDEKVIRWKAFLNP